MMGEVFSQRILVEVSPGTYNVPPLGYGGCERVIFGLSKAISKERKVVIVDFNHNTSKSTIEGLEIYRLRNPFRLERSSGLALYTWNAVFSAIVLFFSILREPSKHRRIILHFHNGAQFSIFWILKKVFLKKAPITSIFSLHSPRWMNPESIQWWQRIFAVPTELFAISHAGLSTFESEAVRKQILTNYRACKNNFVLLNGVDVDFFDRSKYNQIPDSFGVLYGARIKRQKDQVSVVRAMAHVVKEEPRASLLLLGDPEDPSYYEELKKEISQLGLDNNIKVSPSVSIVELNKIRARFPIHLVYSTYTGFDVAIGETLSFGVGCIFSDIPTLKGIAENEVNCLLVKPEEPKVLGHSILSLMKYPDKVAHLAFNARITAFEKLSWSVLSRNFLSQVDMIPNGDDT
ncbi:MAG: glycosyltransferase family 4 protein [Nitrososphaerota archaeon]|jgi:glycosyltransferase involved in cell wall biosynthesis|nr:glycosyltransferase family 4 protein [Nitrososphaerota archaeon]MDG6922701.1 glycosyltransferase family 4 protein [Nitrososphaerota archaeon]